MQSRFEPRVAIVGFGWLCIAAIAGAAGISGLQEDPGSLSAVTPWWSWAFVFAALLLAVLAVVTGVAYLTHLRWGASALRAVTMMALVYATASVLVSIVGWGIATSAWTSGVIVAALLDSMDSVAIALIAAGLIPLVSSSARAADLPAPA